MKIEIRYTDQAPRDMLQQAPDFFRQRLAPALERGANELAREARGLAPKAFSTLTHSIRAIRENALHWFVAPGVGYGPWVEGGRMPMRKMPPKGSLIAWIKIKLGMGEKQAERFEFVLARAIQRQGIQPQPYMKPAFDAKKQRVVDLASQAMRAAVADLNRGGGHVA